MGRQLTKVKINTPIDKACTGSAAKFIENAIAHEKQKRLRLNYSKNSNAKTVCQFSYSLADKPDWNSPEGLSCNFNPEKYALSKTFNIGKPNTNDLITSLTDQKLILSHSVSLNVESKENSKIGAYKCQGLDTVWISEFVRVN